MEKIFYFAQVCNGLSNLSIILLIVCGITLLISSVFYFSAKGTRDEDAEKISGRICKISAPIVIIAALMVIFVPNKQTFLFMAGGHVVDSIVDDHPEVKEIPGNTLDLLNEYIKTATADLKQKKDDSN